MHKRSVGRKISVYDSAYHDDRAYEILSEGRSIASVCAEFGIGRTALHMWRTHNDSFDEAMEQGLAKGIEYWEQWAEDRVHAGPEEWAKVHGFYAYLMSTRYGVTIAKTIRIKDFAKAKTHRERFDALVRESGTGNLTSAEISAMAGVVETGATIEEKTIMRQELDMLLAERNK